jgi:hypothetical protein
MRKVFFSFAVLAIVSFGTGGCSHDKMVTNPNAATPVVTNIQPNPTHADGMIIIAGTRFDQTATFDLRQGGMVKATLTHPIFAAGTPTTGIQIDATIPAGTAVGKYQACVTMTSGTGCGPVLVEVF